MSADEYEQPEPLTDAERAFFSDLAAGRCPERTRIVDLYERVHALEDMIKHHEAYLGDKCNNGFTVASRLDSLEDTMGKLTAALERHAERLQVQLDMRRSEIMRLQEGRP